MRLTSARAAMTRARLLEGLAVAVVLTGCAGLIGVPDLTFDEQAGQTGPDGSIAGDGSADGSPAGDAAVDAAHDSGDASPSCDESKLQTDPHHCGRCGHDCGGGACNAGKCEAVRLATIGGAPLEDIVEHGDELFVSTFIRYVTEKGGIWKLGKTPGDAVLYADVRYAQKMAIVGDTLYFVAFDAVFDDAGAEGGLYACDLKGPTPCVPRLVFAAESPHALAVDQGTLYFNDRTPGQGILRYVPPSSATDVVGEGFTPYQMWVDDGSVYYVSTYYGTRAQDDVGFLWALRDTSNVEEVSRYQDQSARAGDVTGGPNALYFSVYDWTAANGGVVRRVPRPGTSGVSECDYGGSTNKRPSGIHVDGARIYWANQGDFDAPWDNGSIASCDLDGCCAAPTTLWSGGGQPIGITGDDRALYWVTHRSGGVWKVAKP
jgi:hypothetical protein